MSKESNFPKEYGEKLVGNIEKWGYPWFRAGVVIKSNDEEVKYLMVEEVKTRKGKEYVDSYDIWSLPAGRCHPGESLVEAACREAVEETGYAVTADDIVHIGYRSDKDNPYIIVMFSATIDKKVGEPDPEEVRQVAWFAHREIEAMAESGKLRNHKLITESIYGCDHRLGAHHYDIIHHYTPKQ